jgi:hypothetical protein
MVRYDFGTQEKLTVEPFPRTPGAQSARIRGKIVGYVGDELYVIGNYEGPGENRSLLFRR